MNPLLQVSPFASDDGQLIGRDPRDIEPKNWAGRPLLLGLKAIRAKCLDCAFEPSEVRKCVQIDCPLWPLRMGSVPKGYRNAPMSHSERQVGPDVGNGSLEPDLQQNPAHEAEINAEGAL